MTSPALESTIEALLVRGKGILAADESSPTIAKRFADIDLASTEESRRSYRELLFTTRGLNKFISGVILFDDTLRQKTKGDVLMPEVLAQQGIIPGIKVDNGAVALANFAGEKIIPGLDGLMPNDIMMFEKSGLSIAMGNASSQVQAQANFVTLSNQEDGFAYAMDKFVLPTATSASAP